MQRLPPERGLLAFDYVAVAAGAELRLADLVVELEDGVDHHLRPRERAEGVARRTSAGASFRACTRS
jgi:hypothetical protein